MSNPMRTSVTPPLIVGPGRILMDATGRDVLACQRITHEPHEHQLGPTTTDDLVHELVKRYNAHGKLVELICTLIREMSPASAPAFIRAVDLPRIYFHLMKHMRDLGIDVTGPGGPAVLEVPAAPEYREHSIIAKDTWAEAWEAGYKAAWESHKGEVK